jgi:PAS domain S-box-containing protein
MAQIEYFGYQEHTMPDPDMHVLLIAGSSVDYPELHAALEGDPQSRCHLSRAERLDEGYQMMAGGEFDLLLLDLDLPGCRGIETLRQVQYQFPHIPVITLTSRDDPRQALELIRAGALDCLTKNRAGWDLAPRAVRHAVEHRQQATELRQSLARFMSVFNSSPSAQVISEVQTGVIRDANEAYCRMVGFTRQALVGRSAVSLNIWDEEDRQRMVQRALREGGLWNEEIHIRTRGQEPRILRITTQPIDFDDRPCLISTGMDITERALAEEKLRESEERHRLISSMISDYVYSGIITPDGSALTQWISGAFEQITGYGHEEINLLPNGFTGIVLPEDLTLIINGQAELIAQGHRTAEYRIRRKDGQIRWLCDTMQVLSNNPMTGEVRILGAVQDITERKRAEMELRESEERFSTAFFTNPVAQSIITRAESMIVAVNDAVCRLFGYTPEELLGASTAGFVLWDNPAERQSAVEEIQRTGRFSQRETRIRTKNGATGSVIAAIEPITWKGVPCYISSLVDITDRIQAEEKMRESEERFRSLFENSGVVMLVIEPDTGRIVNANAAASAFYGYSHAQLSAMNIDRINQLPNEQIRASRREASTAERSHFIFPHRLADGQIRSVEVYVHPITTQSTTLLYSIIFDVTEQKKTEQDMVYRQALLEKMIRIGKNLTAVTDLDTCLRQIYHTVRRDLEFDRVGLYLYDSTANIIQGIFGTNQQGEMIDTSWVKQPVDTWADWVMALNSPNGITYENNFQARHNPLPGDEMYGVKEHLILAAWAGDKPVAILAVDNGITQRVMAPAELEALQLFAGYAGLAIANAKLHTGLEQRIRERTAEIEAVRQRLELATRAAHLGVWELHLQTGELYWDEQVYAIYGQAPGEFNTTVESFLAIIHPDDIPTVMKYLQDTRAGSTSGQVEYRVIRADGIIAQVKVHGAIQTDDEGKPVNVVGVVWDITQEKQVEINLRESEAYLRASRDRLSAANAALEKAARVKDEFMASMSHELRTPLTGILGISEALQFNIYGEMADKQRNAIKNIEDSGRHLLALINDILDLSKVESGMLEMNIETVSLMEICQAALHLTRGMAQKKSLPVHFSMEPTSVYIRGDARRLKQMLVNLLSNAIKFTPANGSIGLEVRAVEIDQVIRLTVWDTGIGIAPENLEKIFQPFFQLDSSLARHYEGTGLGLSLVQRMAQLHGGVIQVESNPGQGSRFTILLPWSGQTTQPLTASPAASRLPPKVLVLDENEIDAGRLATYLRILDIQATVLTAGEDVVSAARENPAVILLHDPAELADLARLKSDPATSAIPVVVCGLAEQRAQALEKGASGFLVKPITVAELRAELEHISAGKPPSSASGSPPPAAGPALLVADDNEIFLSTLDDYLTARNFRVKTVTSGLDLLALAPDLHPDLILVDIQMPVMDGFETIRQIRAYPDPKVAAVPIIALTALAMSGDRERCEAAGANTYLSKPVSLNHLAQTIRALLDQ